MTALEEWERYCAKHFATETTDYAEAAIAELRAENADLKAHRQTVRENNVRLQAALNEAEAEVERLKCCGNCKHMYTHDIWYECLAGDKATPCNPPLSCQLTPSRWQSREEGK